MIDLIAAGILRLRWRCANSTSVVVSLLALASALSSVIVGGKDATGQTTIVDSSSELTSFVWDFSRTDDPHFKKFPEGWKRVRGVGYPSYVISEITARNQELEQTMTHWDTSVVRLWGRLREGISVLPKRTDPRLSWIPAWQKIRIPLDSLPVLPPSITDTFSDRYLRVVLDGGQFAARSPDIEASRQYQYRFSCQITTSGLRYDTAFAEFVFLDDAGQVIESHLTEPVSGTTDWVTLGIPPVHPPHGAKSLSVRLKVQRSDDGLEDIRGSVGFDNVRIDRLPQLAVTTDRPLGIYRNGMGVIASAKIMGLPNKQSNIQFLLFDSGGKEIGQATRRIEPEPLASTKSGTNEADSNSVGTAVTWRLPPLGPGFYRITAAIDGRRLATLASDTTFVVIDQLVSGPPHGCFGWTLPHGRRGIPSRDVAPWLVDAGVAWVKYPCWLAPENIEQAEETAFIFSRFQDQGIEMIGMLDMPPESQQSMYQLRGRREITAANLFRDKATWQPMLEPIMTRMTLKVRRWQLGADCDHSFLGHPRLNDAISEISLGLQGFRHPIDLAISWPWEEAQYQVGRSSWQAECRSSDPPLSAQELDAYLSQRALDARPESPNTWLLTDPISSDRYGQEARIGDLVLRMATIRSHRVQAAFVSDPRDPKRGLLRSDGRPGELLLPWRTTSRLIGNLRKSGSLKLRNGSKNIVFSGDDRAVLMLWSSEPKEERLYLGDDAHQVDVWGRVTELPLNFDGNQTTQVIQSGPIPTFVVGADPNLLAFRMSVGLVPDRIDSLIGQDQRLSVSLTNPTNENLVGDLRVLSPESWSLERPNRHWNALAGGSSVNSFKVTLTNTALIGQYEVPLQFDIDTIPPKQITVYRQILVGPEGITVKVKTRLLDHNELQVQVELTNQTDQTRSFDCLLFPPPGRQFQERVMIVRPGETVRRDFYWTDAEIFLGKKMTLRAAEQEGPRVINYGFQVDG